MLEHTNRYSRYTHFKAAVNFLEVTAAVTYAVYDALQGMSNYTPPELCSESLRQWGAIASRLQVRIVCVWYSACRVRFECTSFTTKSYNVGYVTSISHSWLNEEEKEGRKE